MILIRANYMHLTALGMIAMQMKMMIEKKTRRIAEEMGVRNRSHVTRSADRLR